MLLSDGASGGTGGTGGGFMSIAEGESHFDATIRSLREFQNSNKSPGIGVGRCLR